MNKAEFMQLLEKSLNKLSREEKQDILYDYEEHFTIGLENGKTEEEISKELGNPKEIGKQYTAQVHIEQAKNNPSASNIFRAFFAVVALGFFNLIFALAPFLVILALIFTLFILSFSFLMLGGCMLLSLITALPSWINIPIFVEPATFFLGIGFICLSALTFIGSWASAKGFYKLMVKYLNWNLNVIKKNN